MAQPSPNDGARQMGMVQVTSAMQMLERAIPTLGSNTPEGKAALRALHMLSGAVPMKKNEDLVPAQIAEMARAQGQSPIAQMMAQGQSQGQGAPQQAQPQPMPMAA